jgi:hypothetical protein
MISLIRSIIGAPSIAAILHPPRGRHGEILKMGRHFRSEGVTDKVRKCGMLSDNLFLPRQGRQPPLCSGEVSQRLAANAFCLARLGVIPASTHDRYTPRAVSTVGPASLGRRRDPSLRPEKATPRPSKKDHLAADLTSPPVRPLLGRCWRENARRHAHCAIII